MFGEARFLFDFCAGFGLFSPLQTNYMRIFEMSRKCVITGKGPMSGNNVSHANNKTKRRFVPNIQDTGVYSVALERWVTLRASAAGLRTLDHKGGLDAFLTGTAKTKLDASLRSLKTQVEKALAKKAA